MTRVFVAIIFFTQNSHGIMNGRDCSPRPVLKKTEELMTVSHGSQSLSARQPYGYQFSTLASKGDQIIGGFQRDLEAALAPELRAIPEYQSHSMTVRGPLTMSLGNNDGSRFLKANLGLGSAVFTGNFKKSKHVLGIRFSVSCQVGFELNQPQFVGNYDIDKNLISLKDSKLNLRHWQDCSSSFSWIPILGNFVDNFINKKVYSKVDSIIQSALNEKLSQSYLPGDFAGLRAALPDNTFIFNNTDYGRIIRENFIDLLTKNTVAVKFVQRSIASSGAPRYNDSGFRFSKAEELFNFRFNESQLAVTVVEEKTYEIEEPVGNGCILR